MSKVRYALAADSLLHVREWKRCLPSTGRRIASSLPVTRHSSLVTPEVLMATAIKTVGVAGSGTMGAGIAIVAARAGFKTIVYDTREEALVRARKQTEGFFAKSVERGKLSRRAGRQDPVRSGGHRRHRRARRLRHRHRGGVRRPQGQARAARAAEQGVPAAHALRVQHLYALDHRDRRRLRPRRPVRRACTSACPRN